MSITDFRNKYQTAPILLVGGIAGQGQLSIDAILGYAVPTGASVATGSASGGAGATAIAGGPATPSPASPGYTYNNFGQFNVLPGGSLIENEIAHYPLANQSVAANAVITNPLRVSLEMIVPADSDVPFSLRQTIMTALKSVLDQHTSLGGYYTVYTPAYIYNNCLLESLTDGSEAGEGSQPQDRWIWTFEQPLLTVQQAQAAQSQAANRFSNKTYMAGDPPNSVNVSTASNSVGNQTVVSSASNIGSTGTLATPANLSSVSPILPGGFA